MSFRDESWMTRAQTVSMLTERWRPPRRTGSPCGQLTNFRIELPDRVAPQGSTLYE